MRYTSLHKIVTGWLLQRRYPIHFYVEALVHAGRCFTELHFDTLGNVRTVKLPINDYGAVSLPCDYLDYSKVGVINGQYVKPLANKSSINRLNKYDETGAKVPYNSADESTYGTWLYTYGGLGYTVRYNDKLEHTGRAYGARGNQTNTFTVLPERKEIQINVDIQATEIILEYISDGQEFDNATMVHPYAISTIEAYINWKHKENNRSYGEAERVRAQREFDHQHRLLRARLNPITITDIKAIINRNSHGGIK